MHKIHFEKRGEGSPMVFLHGLWGGGDYFKNLDLPFASVYTQYYIDELGFGKSDKPDNIDYALATHAASIADIIPDGSVVVAHSFGSLIAIALAHKHREKVKSLVLISPPLYKNRPEALAHLSTSFLSRLTIKYPFVSMALCKLGCSTNLFSLVAPIFFDASYKPFISSCTEHTWHSFYSSFVKSLLGQNFGDYQDIFNTIPSVLIYSGRDEYISHDYLDSLNGAKLQKEVFKNYDHHLIFKNTEALSTALAEFLLRG